jgi:hypothetical protein
MRELQDTRLQREQRAVGHQIKQLREGHRTHQLKWEEMVPGQWITGGKETCRTPSYMRRDYRGKRGLLDIRLQGEERAAGRQIT